MKSILPYQNNSLIDLKAELWKEIPGFEGYVLVSNLGRLKSLARYIERQPVQAVIGKRKNSFTNSTTD